MMNSIQNSVVTEIELEEDFLEKIKEYVEKKKIQICNLNVSAGSQKGDNYLGVIAKLHIDGIDEKNKEVALNWICKTAPKGGLLRKFLNLEKLYAREVYVYEKLFPCFAEFQDERAVLKPFNFHATHILSYLEECSFAMEDMKSIGYVMKDRKKPLDYNYVKLVMEAYGKLHALSFALKDQRPDEFEQIMQAIEESLFNPDATSGEEVRKHREALHARVIKTLDPHSDNIAIEKYKKYKENSFEILERVTKATNQYSVIIHGDSWVNNMLFKYENDKHPRRPTRVCLLDWQLSRYASPALDLSYFIFTCTDKDLRDKHYEHMIKLYYYTLCQHLVDLGSDPEKLFPFSALQSELRNHAVYGLHMSIMLVHLMTSEVDEIPDFQNTEAVEDVKWDYQSVNHSLYSNRIRGIVTDVVKYGYLDFVDT